MTVKVKPSVKKICNKCRVIRRQRRDGPGADLRAVRQEYALPMARLVGVDLPRDKRMEIALTYIFGIGRTRSIETLTATGINPDKRARDLTDEEIVALRDHIESNYKVEGDLKRE